MSHVEEVGPAAMTISDYDWTHPRVPVRASDMAESRINPIAEVYDHTDAVTFHRYANPAYGHNTVPRASLVRHQLLLQGSRRWSLQGQIVTARPGTVIRVEGSDHDNSYLIVRAESAGEGLAGDQGRWDNSLVLQPTSCAYRPHPRSPRPIVPGPETAIVVGPAGEEIHTDEHGRVKVQFHWDRLGQGDERSSTWLRVAQGWSGPGWGSMFIPRVGMEVVVSFLGGNPDRPLVTGCV